MQVYKQGLSGWNVFPSKWLTNCTNSARLLLADILLNRADYHRARYLALVDRAKRVAPWIAGRGR